MSLQEKINEYIQLVKNKPVTEIAKAKVQLRLTALESNIRTYPDYGQSIADNLINQDFTKRSTDIYRLVIDSSSVPTVEKEGVFNYSAYKQHGIVEPLSVELEEISVKIDSGNTLIPGAVNSLDTLIEEKNKLLARQSAIDLNKVVQDKILNDKIDFGDTLAPKSAISESPQEDKNPKNLNSKVSKVVKAKQEIFIPETKVSVFDPIKNQTGTQLIEGDTHDPMLLEYFAPNFRFNNTPTYFYTRKEFLSGDSFNTNINVSGSSFNVDSGADFEVSLSGGTFGFNCNIFMEKNNSKLFVFGSNVIGRTKTFQIEKATVVNFSIEFKLNGKTFTISTNSPDKVSSSGNTYPAVKLIQMGDSWKLRFSGADYAFFKGDLQYNAVELTVKITNKIASSNIFNKMQINNFSESHMEKFQNRDTISDGYTTAVFGKKPKIWMLGGTLLNDSYHKWYPNFRQYWFDSLRGSVLASKNEVLCIGIPSAFIFMECYPVGLSMASGADNEVLPSFSMGFIVKSYRTLPNITLRNFTVDSEDPNATRLSIINILNSGIAKV